MFDETTQFSSTSPTSVPKEPFSNVPVILDYGQFENLSQSEILTVMEEALGSERTNIIHSFLSNPLQHNDQPTSPTLTKLTDTDQKLLADFFQNKPMTAGYILNQLGNALHEFVMTENQQLTTHMHTLIANFFRSILTMYSSNKKWEDSNWVDLTSQSLTALKQTLDIAQNKNTYPLPADEYTPALNQYTLEYANNPTELGLVQILTQVLIADSLHHDKSYQKGKSTEDAMRFYTALAETLYANASESTGDTEKQLSLLNMTIDWLIKTGVLPDGWNWMDAGCGNGERILKKSLEHQHQQDNGNNHGLILAADISPPEPNELWQPIKLDFAQEDFAAEILAQLPKEQKLKLISLIWSPINDINLIEQLSAMHNFIDLLEDGGIFILEIPVGYRQEQGEHFHDKSNTDPFGTITTAFTGKDGEEISKPFMINPTWNYIEFQRANGLKLLNTTDDFPSDIDTFYTTAAGKDRAFLVFQKVDKQRKTIADVLF